MCFDPRKAGADDLVKACRERMAERDDGERGHPHRDGWTVGAALPPRDGPGPGGLSSECADQDCWCHDLIRQLREGPGPAVPLVLRPDGPGDPPRGGASVLARYGTPGDGFAGSILATMAEEREARARRALIDRERAERQAMDRRVGAWWIFGGILVVTAGLLGILLL